MDYRTRIRHVREDKDLTQAQLGKVLQKSQQGYNHIEAGRAELKIEDLITLCKFYNFENSHSVEVPYILTSMNSLFWWIMDTTVKKRNHCSARG